MNGSGGRSRTQPNLAQRTWGPFRCVFYDISRDDQVVAVVAVGRKAHNRLLIGGEEIAL